MTVLADLPLGSEQLPLTDVAAAAQSADLRIEHILVGADAYALVTRAMSAGR